MAVSFIGRGNLSTERKPPTCHKSPTNFITWCRMEYTSPWTGFELITLVMIGTGCIGSCKSTTTPWFDYDVGIIFIFHIYDNMFSLDFRTMSLIEKIQCFLAKHFFLPIMNHNNILRETGWPLNFANEKYRMYLSNLHILPS